MSLTSYRAAPPRAGCWYGGLSRAALSHGAPRCRSAMSFGAMAPCAASVAFAVGGVCLARVRRVGVGWEGLAATDFPAPWGAVSWALVVFTSEFGMGSGVVPPPWPPGRLSQPRAALRLGRRVGVRVWCVRRRCVCVGGDRWMTAVHGGPPWSGRCPGSWRLWPGLDEPFGRLGPVS